MSTKLTRLRSPFAALAVISIAAAPCTGAARNGRTLAGGVDSIAAATVLDSHVVGTVAAVVNGDDTLLLKAYGKANAEANIPMPADALFEIGSVTKQFTAAAVLQLHDRGKLSLHDDITRWLLGLVIEKASGMPYDRYIETQLFEPLGMTHSMARCSSDAAARRPRGYLLQNGRAVRAEYNAGSRSVTEVRV